MCFAPQRRALFRYLNFQKWSEPLVFLTFWLPNVLRATTACTFSTSQLPKVVRRWSVLYILTSKCAARHNGVHFFDISTSKSGPRMVCFVHFDFEMCFAPQRRAIFHLSSGQLAPHPAALASLLFDPPEPQIIGKTQCFATFLPFRASASSFFWLFLFSDLLSSNLSLLSASALLCFSSVHIVGSLTSKLPFDYFISFPKFPYYSLFFSLLPHYYFHIVSILFLSYFPSISLLFSYDFPIISPSSHHYFPNSSSIFHQYCSIIISVLFEYYWHILPTDPRISWTRGWSGEEFATESWS